MVNVPQGITTKKRGRPRGPEKVQEHLWLTPAISETLRMLAVKKGVTKGAVVERALLGTRSFLREFKEGQA